MKSKPKFTPGPWKYDAGSGYVETLEGNLVANPRSGGHLPGQFEANTRANAALIAAAPEMFEALETSLKLLQEAELIYGFRNPVFTRELEKILKKARGEI